jgi:hypothetical protein
MNPFPSPSPSGSSRLRLGLVSLLSILGPAACTTHEPATEDDPQLRALLDDRELEGVIHQAQIVVDAGMGEAGKGGSGGSGGAGGDPGTGGGMGMGGFGGNPCPMPLPPPGAGGAVGTGGSMGGGMRPPADAGAGGGGGDGCPTGPLGNWELDDCTMDRTELRDSSFHNFTAFRTVKGMCTPGIEGSAVSLPNDRDLLYVPDQPAFTFGGGVTVAAWIKPDRLTGQQTIFRKREGLTSSVALMLVDKKLTFIIDRVGAVPIAVTAPAKKAGTWQHVAATYDGLDLRLYVDGTEAATLHRSGTIKGGEGPLLMANDGSARRFQGAVDKIWFDVHAASAATIKSLLCLHKPATMIGTPAMSMAVNPGTPVTFDFAITNNNSAECAPDNLGFQLNTFQPDFTVEPGFQFVTVASKQTAHVPVTITSGEDGDEGSFPFTFTAFNFNKFDQAPATATVTYVSKISGCHVSTARELMIRDVGVVDDPVRTAFNTPGDPREGKWTFKHLIEELSPTAASAPDVVEALLGTFGTPQTVNGFTIEARPGMKALILDQWPRVNGKLDLTRAPLRLSAIVNRIDLRNLDQGHAGEGRFIFNFLSGDFPLQATLILEYQLQAKTEADVKALASQWHALGALPFPSEQYNAALQAITEGFVKRGAAPGKPNGSGLGQLRTNEIDFGDNMIWQLREFTLNAAGQLVPSVVKQTPDRPSFDNSATLGTFVNSNEADILAERHTVPLEFQGAPFAAASVFNDLTTWRSETITNPEARHKFALNTCNGCHSLDETGTFFLQVGGRFPGQPSPLSGFLTGITVSDPVTGVPRTFRDLSRRNADLKMLVCPAPTGLTAATAGGPTVRRGIGRVH